MRKEFMKRIDARDETNNQVKYDPAGYPFGAEEMLLNEELRQLEKDQEKDLEK